MGFAVVSQGDLTCVVSTGTPQTLVNDQAGGEYWLKLDLSNAAAADTFIVRCLTMCRSDSTGAGATARQAAWYSYSNDQDNSTLALSDNKMLGPFVEDSDITFTIQQSAGTARVVPWKVLIREAD